MIRENTVMRISVRGRAVLCLLALILLWLPAYAGAEQETAEGTAETAVQEESAVPEDSSAQEEPAAQEEKPMSVYDAALLMLDMKFDTDEQCRAVLADLGLDYWAVRHMANALAQGYGQVAQDVIDGKYGNNSARFRNLAQNGYDSRLVQQIVNGMLGILR